MTKPADPIADFWKLFRDRATALAAAESDDDASYDELLEGLQVVASGLDLEFRNEPGSSELIIFAEGKPELEPIVEALVAAAPHLEGWTVRTREEMVVFFVPSLVSTLLRHEQDKGFPLDEKEVLDIRDRSQAVMLPASQVEAMVRARGYADIVAENCWQEWQVVRLQFLKN